MNLMQSFPISLKNTLDYHFNGHKSLRQHANYVKTFLSIIISHETVRKSLFKNLEEPYINYNFKSSWYASYDAQWIPHNKKFIYRLVLFNVTFNIPIAETIVKKEDSKTIYDYINKSLPSYRRRRIITDSNQGYDKVMPQLGFTHHQHCIFHLLQHINKKINEKVKKFQVQYKKDLKKANPEIFRQKIK